MKTIVVTLALSSVSAVFNAGNLMTRDVSSRSPRAVSPTTLLALHCNEWDVFNPEPVMWSDRPEEVYPWPFNDRTAQPE